MVKLCCLPYAGGSATMYYRLSARLLPVADIFPLELPGRGMRFDERPLSSIQEMAADAARQIIASVRGEYALLGYSMGGWVAYEALRVLVAENRPPRQVLLCASDPPTVKEESANISELPDDAFIQALIKMGGMPANTSAEDIEIIKTFLPYMRCDFRAINEYQPNIETFDVPAALIYSEAEIEMEDGWNDRFSRAPTRILMPGGHFFIHSHMERFTEALREVLCDAD